MRKLILLALSVLLGAIGTAQAERPSLVVVISVDQLRGDMPFTYKDRFVDKGLRLFLDEGTVYPNAHFGHTTTYTAVGHATLATGGNPREHGLIGNDWFDAETGESVYCVQDTDHTLLDVPTRRTTGTSPKNLLVETIGDVLIDATDGAARVFGVSRKDRSAILMGGKKGEAYWYDSASGRFITSTYYHDAYPKWVKKWNKQGHSDRYEGGGWTLLNDRATYRYRDQDERDVEMTHPILGETFPHSFGRLKGKALYGLFAVTPMADELTVEFAKALMLEKKLGQGDVPDMLMLGLSATDGVGHAFGPYSLEAEDNLLRVDALLDEFFEFVDEHVGLDKTLLVLSADHGVDGNPEGITVGQLSPVEVIATAKRVLNEKFGVDAESTVRFVTPYIYFLPDLVKGNEARLAEMETAVAEAVAGQSGVAYAIPRNRIESGALGDSPVEERVIRSFHPDLSGNVFVIQEKYYRIYSDSPSYTATHGTPYAYDTHVPLMFAGAGIGGGTFEREVGPESIAATLAELLEIRKPSGATGPVLNEVVSE